MQYWLIKTEPGTWSWEDQLAAPQKTTAWDGVRNYLANNHMKAMKKGDRCFFYHSVNEKQIVGIVEVVGVHEPDPSDATGKGFGMVRVKALAPLARPITLAEIKTHKALASMVLVNNSRLSVQPVTASEWQHILQLAESDTDA